MNPRRVMLAIVAVIIAVALMVYVLEDVDYAELWRILGAASVSFFAPFVLVLATMFFLKATRWVRILDPLGVFTARQVGPALMIGFAGNNLLPARLGELLRALVFAREARLPVSAVVTSLVLERLLDLASILILYLVAIALVGDPPPSIRFTVWPAALACAGVLAAACALLEMPQRVTGWWRRFSVMLPARVRDGGERALRDSIRALGSVRSPSALALILLNSIAQWALAGFLVWLSLAALGERIALPGAVVVLAATAFAAMLPSAPGYLGATQAAFVLALTPFGLSHEMALASSLVYTVAQWIPVTLVGVLALFVPVCADGRSRWMALFSKTAAREPGPAQCDR